jgi:ABC-type uncharacterized transport system substrate-binding protein
VDRKIKEITAELEKLNKSSIEIEFDAINNSVIISNIFPKQYRKSELEQIADKYLRKIAPKNYKNYHIGSFYDQIEENGSVEIMYDYWD